MRVSFSKAFGPSTGKTEPFIAHTPPKVVRILRHTGIGSGVSRDMIASEGEKM